MKIIVAKDLSLAIFASAENDQIVNGKLLIAVRDEEGKPITATIHINGHIITVNGEREIKASVIGEKHCDVWIGYKGQRLRVGQIQIVGSRVIPITDTPHNALVAAITAAERATKLSRSFDKRIQALEKAYNGSEITNLT